MKRDKNLVPMPRDQRGRFVKESPTLEPRPMKAWHGFAFLIVVAVLIHYNFHWLIMIIAAYALFVRGYLYLTWRFPFAMLIVSSLIVGLLGGRRGRRW